MPTNDTSFNNLVVNVLTKSQYENTTPNTTELYFLSDDAMPVQNGGTGGTDIATALNNLHLKPIYYGTCNSNAASTTKEVWLTNYPETTPVILTAGTLLIVHFMTTNTANSPLLQIRNTNGYSILASSCPILRFGSTAIGTTTDTSWNNGETVIFTYVENSYAGSNFWRIIK